MLETEQIVFVPDQHMGIKMTRHIWIKKLSLEWGVLQGGLGGSWVKPNYDVFV